MSKISPFNQYPWNNLRIIEYKKKYSFKFVVTIIRN